MSDVAEEGVIGGVYIELNKLILRTLWPVWPKLAGSQKVKHYFA